jgi:hypothetical protein
MAGLLSERFASLCGRGVSAIINADTGQQIISSYGDSLSLELALDSLEDGGKRRGALSTCTLVPCFYLLIFFKHVSII